MMTEEGSTKTVIFMTPAVGVPMLRRGHISYIVKMHHWKKNLLLYSKAQIRQTENIVMGFLCWGVVIKWTCNICSPQLVYTRAWIRQNEYKAIHVMTKEGSSKIVNFITFWARGLMLRCVIVSHYSDYALSSISIYITLIAIVLREESFPWPVLFLIYSLMGQLISKYEPFIQEVSVESLILRWPLMPFGLLLHKSMLFLYLLM